MYLEAEYYYMELEIKLIESEANFAQGNIFIEGTLKNSFREVTLNRMAILHPKNLFDMMFKDALRFVPLADKFTNLEPY